MAKTYLHDCLDQFLNVSEQLSGKPFELKALEKDVRDLRTGEVNIRKLHERCIQVFKNTEH